ncbi:hypothetical protein [Streptomyces sp. NPDC020681]|uniref:hypothetical protein n=1 Tax=Streptomyces sp. NPDC020681 TaxID=3365083 RepID=UPI00379688F6
MSQDHPKTITVDGRTLVSRTWITERTGAAMPTVRTWYAKRSQQPEHARHPDKAATRNRVDYYDQQAFETFYQHHQAAKKQKVLPTDPALYSGAPDDLVSINDAAAYFHYAGPSVIRKYLKANPGYFPQPAGTTTGPTGRPIPAFTRHDLQTFDQQRNGDNTGVSGNPGTPRPRGTTPAIQQRINTAAAYLKETGGYHHGAAAHLANQHGEPAWKWQRAIKTARQQQPPNNTDT